MSGSPWSGHPLFSPGSLPLVRRCRALFRVVRGSGIDPRRAGGKRGMGGSAMRGCLKGGRCRNERELALRPGLGMHAPSTGRCPNAGTNERGSDALNAGSAGRDPAPGGNIRRDADPEARDAAGGPGASLIPSTIRSCLRARARTGLPARRADGPASGLYAERRHQVAPRVRPDWDRSRGIPDDAASPTGGPELRQGRDAGRKATLQMRVRDANSLERRGGE